jgi:hypothetical protein
MRPSIAAWGDALDLRVTLAEIEPAIWRTLRVPAHLTLGQLHDVLQIAMGWWDSHLHEFRFGEVRIGMVDVENEFFVVDEHAAPLGAVTAAENHFEYLYDFGDSWSHDILVERIREGAGDEIVCTGGARACPPEDCGSTGGYLNLLEALMDPKHPEHRAMKRWAPRGFSPEKFNMGAVNKKLAALGKRVARQHRPKRAR